MRLIRSEIDCENRVLVMGILNVTPDSFSDGGLYAGVEVAVDRALAMESEGADMIDIGGESTRPGAAAVPGDVEAARVLPVIEALRGRLRIPVSIDTTKSEVARQAIDLGAEIINDISGLRFDPELATLAARTGAALVLMHSRGTPADMQTLPPMEDPVGEVLSGLRWSIDLARSRGVPAHKLILDPGIGFGKTPPQNLALIANLNLIAEAFGLPLLLGVSRKSFHKLTLAPLISAQCAAAADPRAAGASSLVFGILRGARIVRVHDVADSVVQVRLTEALLNQLSHRPALPGLNAVH